MLNETDPTGTLGKTRKPDPVSFFGDAYHFFQGVSQKVGGSLDKFYDLHGHLIQLSFAGPALIKLTSALAHWEAAPTGSPELTVCLWDSASTQTRMLPPPWAGQPPPYTRSGEVQGYNTDRIRTAFQTGSDVLNMLDLDQGLAVYWTRDAALLPQWEIGSPLRTILHWWLHPFGLQCVHAGAVGTPDGGVLLVGKGGSGKSTTTLTCLDSDLKYVGDDYCLISTNSGPTVYNLYNTGKVSFGNLNRVPHIKRFITNPDNLVEKALIFLNDSPFSDKLTPGFPLKALFIPRITGRLETSLSPATTTDGLSALVPSTMIQLPGAGAATLRIMEKIIEQIPSYYLELGTDLRQIPQAISDFLME